MKFREYGEVRPVTITADTAGELDSQIEELGSKHDIIDLQFAMATDGDGYVWFSALLLVKEKENAFK